MNDHNQSRRLADEADFVLGGLKISPSTGRAFVLDHEIRVEALTMAVLVTLARTRGATVTRDALIEACWQGRIVSDDAVARAIAKVRLLERSTTPAPFTLETLPKIGYRLVAASQAAAPTRRAAARPSPWRSPRAAAVAVLSGIGVVGVITVLAAGSAPPAQSSAPSGFASTPEPLPKTAEFFDALMVLDESRLDHYLRGGWDPNWKLDSEGNAALHQLMMVCERNPSHDQDGVVRVARMLVRAGGDPTTPNKWRDTPIIIARAKRYCGPDHPVVAYLNGVVASRSRTRTAAR